MEPAEYESMFELEDHYWWFLAKRAMIRMLIEAFGPPAPARVLDVGCGTGGISSALSRMGGNWVATDRSQLALEFCRRRSLPRLMLRGWLPWSTRPAPPVSR